MAPRRPGCSRVPRKVVRALRPESRGAASARRCMCPYISASPTSPASEHTARKNPLSSLRALPPQRPAPVMSRAPPMYGLGSSPSGQPEGGQSALSWLEVPRFSSTSSGLPAAPRKPAWLSPMGRATGSPPAVSPSRASPRTASGSMSAGSPARARAAWSKLPASRSKRPRLAARLAWVLGFSRPQSLMAT